jgi:hypothetical protein
VAERWGGSAAHACRIPSFLFFRKAGSDWRVAPLQRSLYNNNMNLLIIILEKSKTLSG